MVKVHPRNGGPALGVLALLGALLACGGGSPSGTEAPALRITPSGAQVKVGGAVTFQATDAGGAPVPATYLVVGGTAQIGSDGRFQAPGQPGLHRIQAQSVSGPLRTGTATVRVDPYSGTITTAPNLVVPRTGHSATLLDNGDVLVLGGWVSSLSERFDRGTETFVPGPSIDQPRVDHSATVLAGARVLVAGGESGSGMPRSALLFEGEAFRTILQALDTPRRRHTETALLDGRVLLAGGLPVRGGEVRATERAELFDPTTETFRATQPMVAARTGHSATRLLDGRVLIVGGQDSTCLFSCPVRFWASAELFDPRTGAFTPTGSMAIARTGHTATLLADGRVLVAGGSSPDLQGTDLARSVEIYDPSDGRFASAGTMLRPRAEHQATLLGDGTVLLSGGRTEGEGTLASATSEAFDPRTGLSRLATSAHTTRYRHRSVGLESGRVLLIGGSEGGGSLDSVEWFE